MPGRSWLAWKSALYDINKGWIAFAFFFVHALITLITSHNYINYVMANDSKKQM